MPYHEWTEHPELLDHRLITEKTGNSNKLLRH